MEAQYPERKLLEHRAQHEQHVFARERRHGGDGLPLRDAVDRADIVDVAFTVLVALVHAVDADEAGAILGCGSPSHGDRSTLGVRTSLGIDGMVGAVRRRAAGYRGATAKGAAGA